MKHVVRSIMLLIAIGVIAAPVFAAELRVTGFFDNIFPHFEQNVSGQNGDNDATRAHDTETLGAHTLPGLLRLHRQR